jgi:hypothetical protein
MALSNLIQRDVYFLKKGDTITVLVNEELAENGWAGGHYFAYTDSIVVDGHVVPVVRRGNGIQRGPFAMYGSDEPEDVSMSYTGQHLKYKYAQTVYGNTHFLTRIFETNSYFDRTGLDTLTDYHSVSYDVLNPTSFSLEYKVGNILYVSERGFLTTEKITEAHDPVGYIFQEPKEENSLFLGVANIS